MGREGKRCRRLVTRWSCTNLVDDSATLHKLDHSLKLHIFFLSQNLTSLSHISELFTVSLFLHQSISLYFANKDETLQRLWIIVCRIGLFVTWRATTFHHIELVWLGPVCVIATQFLSSLEPGEAKPNNQWIETSRRVREGTAVDSSELSEYS